MIAHPMRRSVIYGEAEASSISLVRFDPIISTKAGAVV
jgi:hypothetical protein